MSEYLLISDVDDTLLGRDAALERFRAWIDGHPEVVAVAYSSGRFIDSVLGSVASSRLPDPVAVVGGVGTEIRTWPGGGAPLEAWTDKLRASWDADRVRALLVQEPDLELQPASEQSTFKVSFYASELTPSRLEALRERVRETGVRADLVYSSRRDLDFLPEGVDKGSAARFLAEHLGFDRERVLVAGNSGNDRALFEQGFRGVVVGNAHDELKRAAGPRVYVARAGWADGVLEGIEHWLRRDGRWPEPA